MRVAAFGALVMGLLMSWLSLGSLKWVDLPFNKRPFMRWQDLSVPLESAADVTSEFTRAFIGIGLIFLVSALSALAPAVLARTKILRVILAVVYLLVLVASIVVAVMGPAESSDALPAGEARLVSVIIVVSGVLLGALPAVLLFVDKAWLLGGLIAVLGLAGAVALALSLYDLFAEAVTGAQIGGYAAVVGLLVIAAGGALAALGGYRLRHPPAPPADDELAVGVFEAR